MMYFLGDAELCRFGRVSIMSPGSDACLHLVKPQAPCAGYWKLETSAGTALLLLPRCNSRCSSLCLCILLVQCCCAAVLAE